MISDLRQFDVAFKRTLTQIIIIIINLKHFVDLLTQIAKSIELTFNLIFQAIFLCIKYTSNSTSQDRKGKTQKHQTKKKEKKRENNK